MRVDVCVCLCVCVSVCACVQRRFMRVCVCRGGTDIEPKAVDLPSLLCLPSVYFFYSFFIIIILFVYLFIYLFVFFVLSTVYLVQHGSSTTLVTSLTPESAQLTLEARDQGRREVKGPC